MIRIGSLNISMTVLNYVRLQNLMNDELIINDLWTMAICGQHGTRTLGQSALTIGPWRLRMDENWQSEAQIQKQRQFLIIAYRKAKLPVKESPERLITRKTGNRVETIRR